LSRERPGKPPGGRILTRAKSLTAGREEQQPLDEEKRNIKLGGKKKGE